MKLGERLTYWTAPHPQWEPNSEWPEEVGCVLYALSDMVVLVDPLIREDLDTRAWEWLDDAVAAASVPVGVLLTAPWHERSTRAVVARYDARVWVEPGARRRIADLPRLDDLPAGIDAFRPRGVDEGQVALLLRDARALVVAEFFLGTPAGLQVLPSPATRDLREFAASLAELERERIDHVLVSHGPPVLNDGMEAIRAALHSFEDSSQDLASRENGE
jgi:glyoxylase-like metal-dependent hydrolase (beta-lactamase superfamily II)